MSDTVRITGDALDYLKVHSQLVQTMLEDEDNKDVFEIDVELLPNKSIDALFLQEWIDGKKIGERKNDGSFTLAVPFTEEQVYTLLDFMMVAHPTTLVDTFRMFPALGKPGNLVITHSMRKPLAKAATKPALKNYNNYIPNYYNNNEHEIKAIEEENAKRARKRFAYVDPNDSNNSNRMKPWAKRAATKRGKGKARRTTRRRRN